MILDGKYIKISEEEIKTVLDLLEKIGYTIWSHGNRSEVETYATVFDPLYIYTEGANLRWSSHIDDVDGLNNINVNVLLREYKLKRILK